MGDILRHLGKNIAGINKLEYVFKEDVASLDYDETNSSVTICLRSGCSWNSVYGTPETIQLETDQQETTAGIKYVHKSKMLIPKDRAVVETELYQMAQRQLILRVTDKCYFVRVYGSLEQPIKMIYKQMKPGPIEGFNGYEVTFTGETIRPAGYIVPDSSSTGGVTAID